MRTNQKILTVSQLTNQIASCLYENFDFLWVIGEISNLRQSRGHMYFSLKDEKSQIQVVLFKEHQVDLRYKLQDGLEVIVGGALNVYPRRGYYQIIAKDIEPRGKGALQLAFEQLKEKLQKQGLFDERHKKPLPFMPRKIGIVTSPTGAALQDMLNRILAKMPKVHVLVYPARVQGEGAVDEIVDGIKFFNKNRNVDIIIIGRGGGSIEDLWAFNEEKLAYAISESTIPIISAVGHEIDVSISDLVADYRALTPTAAGEKVVPDLNEILNHLDNCYNKLYKNIHSYLDIYKDRLESYKKNYILKRPENIILQRKQDIDIMGERLLALVHGMVNNNRQKIQYISDRLQSINPFKILARGYSITRNEKTKRIIKSIENVKIEDTIITSLTDGVVISLVKRINKDRKHEEKEGSKI